MPKAYSLILTMQENLYDILQISPSAEPEIIEAAYRRLARMRHPDVNSSPNAHAQMSALNRAYDILKDPTRRRRYDQDLARESAHAQSPPRHSHSSRPTPPPHSTPPPRRAQANSPHSRQTRPQQPPPRPQSHRKARPASPHPHSSHRDRRGPPQPPVISISALPFIQAALAAIIAGLAAAAISGGGYLAPERAQTGISNLQPIITLLIYAIDICLALLLAFLAFSGPFNVRLSFAHKLIALAANFAFTFAAIAIAAALLLDAPTALAPREAAIPAANFALGAAAGFLTRLYSAALNRG